MMGHAPLWIDEVDNYEKTILTQGTTMIIVPKPTRYPNESMFVMCLASELNPVKLQDIN